jgi:hypothetical protein
MTTLDNRQQHLATHAADLPADAARANARKHMNFPGQPTKISAWLTPTWHCQGKPVAVQQGQGIAPSCQ